MFIKPCKGRITSPFNLARLNPIQNVIRPHWGVDFGHDGRDQVNAAASGKVTRSGEFGGYGNVVFIVHEINGTTCETVYAHLRSFNVKVGDSVTQGQEIGIKGNTGDSTGVHLHFEIHVGGRWNNKYTYAVDPIPLIIDDDVKKIQKLLNQTGANLIVDGKQGPATVQAIRDFQKENRMAVDGIAGPITMAKLNEVIAAGNTPTVPMEDRRMFNPSSSTLKVAYEQYLVDAIQEGLISDKWLTDYKFGKLSLDDALALKVIVDQRRKDY